ncbi:MAG: DNA cytosine methyltransferase [Rikenellaceae bacterium]
MYKSKLTHASLFSGIGGFDLAAEWAGFENIFHCDYDTFCRQALDYHFPNSDSYADITQTDFTPYRGAVTVLSGGFPCQPFSLAGKRRGADDSRYLWPQMLRAIREVRPTWIIGENVIGITSMVLPSENISVDEQGAECQEGDFVIEQICRDLEHEGYSVQPFVIPACSVGAPHKRDRVWIIARLDAQQPAADTRSERCDDGSGDRHGGQVPNNLNGNASQDQPQRSRWQRGVGSTDEAVGSAPDSDSDRCHQDRGTFNGRKEGAQERPGVLCNAQRPWEERTATDTSSIGQERRVDTHRSEEAIHLRPPGLPPRGGSREGQISDWSLFPTQPPLYAGDDGVPRQLAGQPLSHKAWRRDAVKASGNAIVPQVAFEILSAIMHIELNS